MLAATSFSSHPHQGKADLLQKLPARLRGYASWVPDTWRIIVVVDRDDDGCHKLKAGLEKTAAAAGLLTPAKAKKKPYVVVNRLAIEELEAWYFGDWEAVRAAYPHVNANVPSQAKYRNPDAIKGGTWEAFERLLQKAGYFETGLRKIEAARAVGQHMVPDRNRSASFQALRSALGAMVAA
jgi:integrase